MVGRRSFPFGARPIFRVCLKHLGCTRFYRFFPSLHWSKNFPWSWAHQDPFTGACDTEARPAIGFPEVAQCLVSKESNPKVQQLYIHSNSWKPELVWKYWIASHIKLHHFQVSFCQTYLLLGHLWSSLILHMLTHVCRVIIFDNRCHLESNTTISWDGCASSFSSKVVSTHLWNTPRATFTNRLFIGIPFIIGGNAGGLPFPGVRALGVCYGPHPTFNESTCLDGWELLQKILGDAVSKVWPPETNNHNKGGKISYIICIYIYKPPSTVLIYI